MKKRKILFFGLLVCGLSVFGEPIKSMLGADGAELQEEWNPTAADYIMDGLIRQLDSIEMTGYGIEDHASGTRLKNLATGANSGVIIDSNVISDGKWMILSKSLFNGLFPETTLDIADAFFKDTFTLEYYGVLSNVIGLHDTSSEKYGWKLCGIQTFGVSAVYVTCGNNYIVVQCSHDEPMHFALVRDGDVCYFYVNGKLRNTFSASVSGIAPNLRGFYLYKNAIFGSYRFYNVALSPDEVFYNYSIDKVRFGL